MSLIDKRRVGPETAAIRNFTADAFSDPGAWEEIAKEIGEHNHVYDLGDSSHRLDVVQLVCEAVVRIINRRT